MEFINSSYAHTVQTSFYELLESISPVFLNTVNDNWLNFSRPLGSKYKQPKRIVAPFQQANTSCGCFGVAGEKVQLQHSLSLHLNVTLTDIALTDCLRKQTHLLNWYEHTCRKVGRTNTSCDKQFHSKGE